MAERNGWTTDDTWRVQLQLANVPELAELTAAAARRARDQGRTIHEARQLLVEWLDDQWNLRLALQSDLQGWDRVLAELLSGAWSRVDRE